MLSDDDFMLAAEYVLGLVDTADEAAATARIAVDAEFATEVEAWQKRLLPLLDGADALPPDHIWAGIAGRLLKQNRPANDNSPNRIWQMLTGLSVTAALVLAVMLVRQPAPVAPITPAQPMIAALGSDTGKAAVTARYSPDKGDLLMTPVSLDTGELYPELWIIPADGKPRSLGIIHSDTPTVVTVAADLRQYLNEGATLAVTPEPETGGPGGQPTGPVIASGKIITI